MKVHPVPTQGTHVMQLVVKPTGVAHRVAVGVAAPQGGRGGSAVGAAGAGSSRGGLHVEEERMAVRTVTAISRELSSLQ